MYYPVCRGAVPWSANVAGMMLLGGIDDIAFPALCDAAIRGMQPDQPRTVTYVNAPLRGFDMRGFWVRADQPSGSLFYNAEAAKASWSGVTDFLKKD